MINTDTLTITDDMQLRPYGIFTTDSDRVGQDHLLSRQDFRDAQQEDLDEYPTDDTFRLTVISMIEQGTGVDLSWGWGKIPQAALYVHGRRPSQPDFLIDPAEAREVLAASRYRVNSLADGDRLAMNRGRLSVLRGALARTGLDVITMEEFEQPLRLSGDVFMSPPWRKEALERDPFMLTLDDFSRYIKELKIDEGLVHAAFSCVGRELLGDSMVDSSGPYKTAYEYLQGHRYIDHAVGLFSLDSAAAYRVVFERWRDSLRKGKKLPFESEPESRHGECHIDKILQLAQLAISDKIPNTWFNRSGEFIPPRREEDFDF